MLHWTDDVEGRVALLPTIGSLATYGESDRPAYISSSFSTDKLAEFP